MSLDLRDLVPVCHRSRIVSLDTILKRGGAHPCRTWDCEPQSRTAAASAWKSAAAPGWQ